MTPIATATNTAGPPIPVGTAPLCDRDHAGRQDRLRHQRRLGHGDPDRDRHQHRRAADPDRKRPLAIAITPDGKTAYVTNDASGTVTPIDDRHQHRRAADPGRRPLCHRDHAGRQDRLRRQPGLGHGDPDRDRHQHRRAADPGRKLSPMPLRSRRTARPPTSLNASSGTVTPITTATNTAGPPIPVGNDPYAIAITPDGKTAYVANAGSGTVTPIATATNTAGAPIPVGKDPYVIAITPDGKTAYVTNYNSGTVTPIATATNTAGPPIPTGKPTAIAITPDGKTAYVVKPRLGHGDPDRDRHQHRRAADHGRKLSRLPSRSRPLPSPTGLPSPAVPLPQRPSGRRSRSR